MKQFTWSSVFYVKIIIFSTGLWWLWNKKSASSIKSSFSSSEIVMIYTWVVSMTTEQTSADEDLEIWLKALEVRKNHSPPEKGQITHFLCLNIISVSVLLSACWRQFYHRYQPDGGFRSELRGSSSSVGITYVRTVNVCANVHAVCSLLAFPCRKHKKKHLRKLHVLVAFCVCLKGSTLF